MLDRKAFIEKWLKRMPDIDLPVRSTAKERECARRDFLRALLDDLSGAKPAPHALTDVQQELKEDGVRIAPASLTFDIRLVGHGIESDVYSEGKPVGSYCRDFSDTYDEDDLKQRFYSAITKAIMALRDRL